MPYCAACGGFHAEDATFCPFCGARIAAAEAAVRYAGFWKRAGAAVVDEFALGLPLNVLVQLAGGPGLQSSTRTDPATGAQTVHLSYDLGRIAVVVVASVLVRWIYFAAMESSARQATLGKMAIGIVVTDGDGARITFARATGRYVAKFLSIVTLYIGFMMAGWTARKQALHDKVANTLVVVKPT